MEKTEVHIEQVRRANEKWVKLWYKKARQIVLFRQKNKRWPDPESHNRQELALGLWKRKLRKYYRVGKLPEKLIQYLRGNDFYFGESERWRAKFNTLKNYVKEHDGGLPTGSHPLSEWVQSLYYKFESLPPEKKKALTSISFMTLVTKKKMLAGRSNLSV